MDIMKTIKWLGLTKREVIGEAKSVLYYNEYTYIDLMNYSYDELMDAANQMDEDD